MNFKKIIDYLKSHQPLSIILGLVLVVALFILYNGISTEPVRLSFNKAWGYFLVGDCDKYSESYNVSFDEKFLEKFGDTDWPGDATYQKKSTLAENCKENHKKAFDIKIKKVSRENFSDTAFIQADFTTVNDNGVHHNVPTSLVMKKIDGKWFLNAYCDTENDSDCK